MRVIKLAYGSLLTPTDQRWWIQSIGDSAFGLAPFMVFTILLWIRSEPYNLYKTVPNRHHDQKGKKGKLLIVKGKSSHITSGYLHKQINLFWDENRERMFRLCLSRVIVTASQGMYISKIRIQPIKFANRRMLCCGELSRRDTCIVYGCAWS